MKKLFILFSVIILPLLSYGQLNGLGTFASPYSGTFQGDLQWNSSNFPGGKVYINGDVTIDNELLTIAAGISVIFLSEGADLIFIGTGYLNAPGTSGNQIIFTADDDNDGNYGETNERWGHIVFNNPSGTNHSSLEFCTIEYGDVRSGSNTSSYGGAIYSNIYSNFNVNNCTIRFNKATHGGGIMAWNGASPNISNTTISENSANTSGGGLYLYRNINSIFTNCIINNNASGTGGGGGIFLDACANLRVINSIIVKNTSTSPTRGFNVHYFGISGPTNRPSFINCIVWDADNSIDYYSATVQPSDFVYSAIKDISTPASSFTNCIDLNTLNDAVTGPNFIDPVIPVTDWSIKFISPCRDAGTTPSPAVPNDYVGNTRIGPYDIGALELQYSRWKTTAASTDWTSSSNWDTGVPTNTSDVVIPSGATNYPTGSPSQDFTIGSGKQMIIQPGAAATLNNLTNNGILKLNSSSAGFSSLIINSYTKGGGATEEIQLYLTGGGDVDNDNFKWHYISTPVSSLPVSTFAPGTTLDVAQFIESRPVLSLMQGWVGYDGYVYSTGLKTGPTFTSLTPGKGYNYWDNANNTFTFSGTLNTANFPMSLGFSGTPSLSGFNLLGNPYSSGLNWNDIVNNVYFPYPVNTSKSLYFTRDNTQCSYIAGVGIPGDVTGIIPPMQGFFTKTYSTGNTITIPAAARTNSNIHPRYKGGPLIPLVRLILKRNNATSDETVVRFDDLAKSYLDNDFDAVKMFISPTLTQIYSKVDGINYAINGLPFPESFVEIPLVINVTKDTIHTITATQLDDLDNYDVTLRDNTTGFIADLKTTPVVTFSVSPGTISDRFILKISTLTTGFENTSGSDNTFNIYTANGNINIVSLSDDWNGKAGSIRVLDLTGKTINNFKDIEFIQNNLLQVTAPAQKGVYVVELRSGLLRHVGKVIIR